MSAPRRKLTTIFSADVQGYSRLMEADEEGTLAILKQYRDAMARLIESHAGRVVNTWGDGLIAEFASVVEAVRAAIDVQNELAERNAARPTEAHMLFRIGINLGDVIADGDDIYGDGVNIAARLQTSAPPGGIVISNTVYDQVRNKVAVGFEFLGDLTVKNIAESVPSYSVRIGGRGDAAPAEHTEEQSPPPVFGRERARVPAEANFVDRLASSRAMTVLALIMVVPVVINLLSWEGEFWARWPLMAFAWLAGHVWATRTSRVDRGLATLGVIALGIVAINLLSWHGEFWARWPLLGIAIAAGIRWILRRGPRDRPAR
jgi:adenylate cyclase